MDYWNQECVELSQVENLFTELASRLELLEMNSKNVLYRLTIGTNPDRNWEAIAFIREFFDSAKHGYVIPKHEIRNRIRLLSEASLISCLRWLLHRIPGGVITWSTYKLFDEAETRANYPVRGFDIFMKHATKHSCHFNILKCFLKLLMSLSAKLAVSSNSSTVSSLELVSQIASIWAFDWPMMNLQETFIYWDRCTNACLRLLLCYIRYTNKSSETGFSCLPSALQSQLQSFNYPPSLKKLNDAKAHVFTFSMNYYMTRDPLEMIQIVTKMNIPDHLTATLPRSSDDIQNDCLFALRQVSKRSSYHSVFSAQESAWTDFIKNGFDHPILPTCTQETVYSLLTGNDTACVYPFPNKPYRLPDVDFEIFSHCSFESLTTVTTNTNIWWVWAESRCTEIPESKRTVFPNCTMLIDKTGRLIILQQTVPQKPVALTASSNKRKNRIFGKIRRSFKRILKPRKINKTVKIMSNSQRRSCQSVLSEGNRTILLHLADQMNACSLQTKSRESIKTLKLIEEKDEYWEPETAGYFNTIVGWADQRKSLYDEAVIKINHSNMLNTLPPTSQGATSTTVSSASSNFLSSSCTPIDDTNSVTGSTLSCSFDEMKLSDKIDDANSLKDDDFIQGSKKDFFEMNLNHSSYQNKDELKPFQLLVKHAFKPPSYRLIRPPLRDWQSSDTLSSEMSKSISSSRSSPFSLEQTISKIQNKL